MLRNLRRRSQQCDTENQAHSWADVLLQLSFTFLIYSFFFFLERSPSARVLPRRPTCYMEQDNLQPKASKGHFAAEFYRPNLFLFLLFGTVSFNKDGRKATHQGEGRGEGEGAAHPNIKAQRSDAAYSLTAYSGSQSAM